MKLDQGCEEELPEERAMFDIPDFGLLRRCPVAALTGESREAMALYPLWRDNRLGPVDGLPGVVVDEMLALQAVVMQSQREDQEKDRGDDGR